MGFIYFYSKLPWEWGLMDDPHFAVMLQKNVDQFGIIQGIIHNFTSYIPDDRTWGMFRPGLWLYISTAYLLSPGVCYAVRLLTILSSVFFLCFFFFKKYGHEKTFYLPLALIVLASPVFYAGLGIVSIQETPGVLFVVLGLGLIFSFSNSIPLLILSFIFIFSAAVLKAPFIWVAFSASAFLYLNKKKASGLILFFLTFLLFTVIYIWSKSGSYTGRIYHFDIQNIAITLKNFFRAFKYPLALIILDSCVMGPLPEKHWKEGRLISLVFLMSGFLYLGVLFVWGAGSYHLSPPIFMVSVGIFMFLRTSRDFFKWKPLFRSELAKKAYYAFSIIVILFVSGRQGLYIYHSNQGIVGLRDWALTIPSETRICTSGYEAASTFPKLMSMRSIHWNNVVNAITQKVELKGCDFLFYLDDDSLANGLRGNWATEVSFPGNPFVKLFKIDHSIGFD